MSNTVSAIPIEANSNADGESQSQDARCVQVWDLPLRVFHWSLVLAIAAAYVTAEFGGSEWTQWHGRIGWFVLALLVFRIVWGFIGSEHARFRNFVPTPARVVSYLRGRWQGAGHNPLGAVAVIALLLLVAAQVVTGLFANDDIAFTGPLFDWVGKSTSDGLTRWHQQIFYVLAGCIGLHVVAIVFYLLVRRSNLISPMLTGHKSLEYGEAVAGSGDLRWRFVAAVLVATAVSSLVFRGPSPVHAENNAPPVATADW